MSVIDESGVTGYGEVPSKAQMEATASVGCGKTLPPVNKKVLVCMNDGENVNFVVAHRVHADIEHSWVYYSPYHGEEYDLEDEYVVDWHPLP